MVWPLVIPFNHNWWYNWIIIFITNDSIIYKTNGLQLMPGTVFLLSVHTPWGVWFFFLIKCICIVEFCLSFYFSYHRQFSTLKCRIMLNFVRFCRTCLLYTLLFPQLFPMYIAYIIIVSMYTIYFLLCIQYTI